MLLYGFINLKIMSIEKEKKILKEELDSLENELLELKIKYEETTNPKNLIEKALENLNLKFDRKRVIIIDKREFIKEETENK